MRANFTDILAMDFVPLSDAKAKLSEWIRKILSGGRRLTITTNGRPTAVLLSYTDFTDLLRQIPTSPSISAPKREIDWKDWKKGRKKRAEITRFIDGLFDSSLLPRKGQKSYKRERVRAFDR